MASCLACGETLATEAVPDDLCRACTIALETGKDPELLGREQISSATVAQTKPPAPITYAIIAINVLLFVTLQVAAKPGFELGQDQGVRWGADWGPLSLHYQWWRMLAGHPVVGASWEGFVIEALLAAAPERVKASFYRTATGAEIDLVLELGGRHGLWAIEIKRGLTATPERGFYHALEDLHPARSFIVYSGTERYPLANGIEAISVRRLAEELAIL